MEREIPDVENMYPSAKKALTEYREWLNLRCIVKGAFWHGSHGLLAAVLIIFGLPIALLIRGGEKVMEYFEENSPKVEVDGPSDETKEKIDNTSKKLGRAKNRIITPGVKKAARITFGALAVVVSAVGVLGVLYLFIKMILSEPMVFLQALVTSFGIIAGIFVLAYLHEKFTENKDKIIRTPGVRRLYGICPVDMDMEPKWFQKIFDDV